MINRDPRDAQDEMERGQVTPAATIHEKDFSLMQSPMASDEGETRQIASEREGSVILSEWREGPHQVIERKTGSGEEVCLPLLYCSASWGADGSLPKPRLKLKSAETSTPQKTWSA